MTKEENTKKEDKTNKEEKKLIAEQEEKRKRNIYQRLLAVEDMCHYVQKDDEVIVGGKRQYSYVTHDKVTITVGKALRENGVKSICTLKSRNTTPVQVNKTNYKTKEPYQVTEWRDDIRIEVKFINVDKPEEMEIVEYYGTGQDNLDKSIGKAISYAYKYCLLKTFNMGTGDDPEQADDPNAEVHPLDGLGGMNHLHNDTDVRKSVDSTYNMLIENIPIAATTQSLHDLWLNNAKSIKHMTEDQKDKLTSMKERKKNSLIAEGV